MDMAYPAGVRTMPPLAFPGPLEYCTSGAPASSAQRTTASYRTPNHDAAEGCEAFNAVRHAITWIVRGLLSTVDRTPMPCSCRGRVHVHAASASAAFNLRRRVGSGGRPPAYAGAAWGARRRETWRASSGG